MPKLKKPLLIAAGALVLTSAAVLGILSIVKTTPWELTYHIVPSDVTTAFLWKGASSVQLTEDEIISVVHLLNRLDKSSFSIKYGFQGIESADGIVVQCGDLEVRVSRVSGKHAPLVMTFDKTTSDAFIAGRWYLKSDALASYIETRLASRAAEIPKT